MLKRMAILKNVVKLRSAYDALATRDEGIPGMALVHGFTGAGKTTAIAWLVNQVEGIYVRATATWTPSTMLGTIMQELAAAPLHRSAQMVNHIVQQMAVSRRSLFVDEADYLLSNMKMLETLRDIHDLSGCPVTLIGMEGIERRLVHRLQLTRRISEWVEFLPADLDDAHTLAETVCEVSIESDLLNAIHLETRGNVGLMVVGLARVEALAKANGWKNVDTDRWGDRQLFLSGSAKGSGRVIKFPGT